MAQLKVLISDEVFEKTITEKEYASRSYDETCEYPFVKLQDGERFYFNRFVFL